MQKRKGFIVLYGTTDGFNTAVGRCRTFLEGRLSSGTGRLINRFNKGILPLQDRRQLFDLVGSSLASMLVEYALMARELLFRETYMLETGKDVVPGGGLPVGLVSEQTFLLSSPHVLEAMRNIHDFIEREAVWYGKDKHLVIGGDFTDQLGLEVSSCMEKMRDYLPGKSVGGLTLPEGSSRYVKELHSCLPDLMNIVRESKCLPIYFAPPRIEEFRKQPYKGDLS